MDVKPALVAIVLGALAAPLDAQTVYRCRSSDGWAYQDRPCSGAQADAGTHTIRATAAGTTPPAVQQMLDQQARKAERAQQSDAFEVLRARQPPPRLPAPARKGYRCVAGRGFSEKTVFQYEPCPERMEIGRQTFTHVETRSLGLTRTETTITDVSLPVTGETTQKEVSAAAVCEAKRAQQDPYDRARNPVRCP